MNTRVLSLIASALLLSGCASVQELLSFNDPPPPAPPQAAAVAPAAAQPSDWCQHVAANTGAQAVAAGFDAATQKRMVLQSFQQCTAMAQQG